MSSTTLGTFKICLFGNTTGKSSLVDRVLGKNFDKKKSATFGAEVQSYIMKTNKGNVIFNIWDCAGQEKFEGLGDGYYIKSDGAIFFIYDDMYKTKAKLLEYKRVSRYSPIVFVWGMADKVDKPTYLFAPLINISNVNEQNIYEPFLQLAQTLLKRNDLVLI